MIAWKLELRQAPSRDIDASPIRLDVFRKLSQTGIERVRLGAHDLGDLFRVKHETQSNLGAAGQSVDRIVFVGDLSRFNNVASQHRHGDFIVEGSVGNGLGGPHGASQTGMRGGLLHVRGNAGDYVGHRMRRGTLIVEGNVGALLASQIIAGTILVGGTLGAHPAYGMRRGTLVLAREVDLCSNRFTPRIPSFTPFHALLARSIRFRLGGRTTLTDALDQLEFSGQSTRRGDLAVGGQGEIVVPLDR